MNDEDWLQLADVFQPLMDMVIGHRTKAVQAGFDTHMADYMAAQLHGMLLQRIFPQGVSK